MIHQQIDWFELGVCLAVIVGTGLALYGLSAALPHRADERTPIDASEGGES